MTICYKCVKVPKMMEELEDKKDTMKDGEYLTRSNIIMKLYQQAECNCNLEDTNVEINGNVALWNDYGLYSTSNDRFVIVEFTEDDKNEVVQYFGETGNFRERICKALEYFRQFCMQKGETDQSRFVFNQRRPLIF